MPLGANLLVVGDEAGVKLPRACRTGLCGSCTCEVKDNNAIDGFATIRACSANVFIQEGENEMVVDVYRMKQGQVGGAGSKGGKSVGAAPDSAVAYVSTNLKLTYPFFLIYVLIHLFRRIQWHAFQEIGRKSSYLLLLH